MPRKLYPGERPPGWQPPAPAKAQAAGARAAINKHVAKFEASQLLDGETVIAFARAYRADTMEGALVLTDRRLCFMRAGMMSDKFEPYPLARVSSVEAVKGLLLFKMKVHTSGDAMELTLVDGPAAGAVFVKQVQQALIGPASPAPAPAPPAPPASDAPDILAQLEKLGALRAAGVLSDAEFEDKKAVLLSRL